MKKYLDKAETLAQISEMRNTADASKAEADWASGVADVEAMVKNLPDVDAVESASAKAATEKAVDKAVNKIKAEAKNEIDAAKAETAALADELAELKAKMAAEKVNEVAPARWIHVSERLPEEGSLSIAFGNGTKGVTTAYYRAEMNMWKNGTINWWMSMPEAPVEE